VSHADDDNHAPILMPRSQVQFRAAILIKTMSLIFQPIAAPEAGRCVR
jgi:hypothetical protein